MYLLNFKAISAMTTAEQFGLGAAEPTRIDATSEVVPHEQLAQYLEAAKAPIAGFIERFNASSGRAIDSNSSIFAIRAAIDTLSDEAQRAEQHALLSLQQAAVDAQFDYLISEYGSAYVEAAASGDLLAGSIIDEIVNGGSQDAEGKNDKPFTYIVKSSLASDAVTLVQFDMWPASENLSDNYDLRAKLMALPAINDATAALEVKVADKLQDTIVPAVAGMNKAKVLVTTAGTAISAPLNFLAISALLNDSLSLNKVTALMILLLANAARFAIPAFVSDAQNTKMDQDPEAGQASRMAANTLAVSTGDQYVFEGHGKRLLQLMGRAPQEFLDAIEKAAGGTVNYLRIATLLSALSIALPYPVEKFVTEPREAALQEKIAGDAKKAATEFSAKLILADLEAVRKELSEASATNKAFTRGKVAINMTPDLLLDGEDCDLSNLDPESAEKEESSALYSSTLTAWLVKGEDSYQIIIPTDTQWDLSNIELQECFATKSPKFGARVVLAKKDGNWSVTGIEEVSIHVSKTKLTASPVPGEPVNVDSLRPDALGRIEGLITALNAKPKPAIDEGKSKKHKKAKKKRK